MAIETTVTGGETRKSFGGINVDLADKEFFVTHVRGLERGESVRGVAMLAFSRTVCDRCGIIDSDGRVSKEDFGLALHTGKIKIAKREIAESFVSGDTTVKWGDMLAPAERIAGLFPAIVTGALSGHPVAGGRVKIVSAAGLRADFRSAPEWWKEKSGRPSKDAAESAGPLPVEPGPEAGSIHGGKGPDIAPPVVLSARDVAIEYLRALCAEEDGDGLGEMLAEVPSEALWAALAVRGEVIEETPAPAPVSNAFVALLPTLGAALI